MFKFFRKSFFTGYREIFGALGQAQVDGIEFLLGKIEGDSEWKSVQQVSYFAATVAHETAWTFQPIKEYRGRVGTKSRATQDRYWGTGFFGRGFVQLTHKQNYKKAGDYLGLDLVENPDLALEPESSYRIAATGMREGWFTGKKLSDYVKPGKIDYFNARRVVNGIDKAEQIAKLARQFEAVLATAEQDAKAEPSEIVIRDNVITSSVSPPAPEETKQPPIVDAKAQDTVTVQKVAQSLGSKVMAGGALVTTLLTGLVGAFLGIIKNPYAFAILIVGGSALAIYSWNESKNRQMKMQLDLNAKAASRDLNTVVMLPQPPAES